MGTPARTNILLNTKAALEEISTTNGYNTDVETVETFLRGRDDVKPGERPYLGLGAGRETVEHQAFQDMKVTMPMVIVGYINEADWTTRSETLNLLIDDVIAALSTDATFDSNATSIYFDAMETDEPDPDAGKTGGTMIIESRIVYRRDVNLS